MKNFREIFIGHNGKVANKWDIYLNTYSEKLAYFKDFPIRILEIGIQNGGSLEIWENYFHEAWLIVGCDINPRCSKLNYDSQKIRVVVGNINEQSTQKTILNYSNYYDLIIDDGSHNCSDIISTFANYFKYLSNNGVYVIEDLHCSYWKQFGGGLDYPNSSISFLKKLVDICNYEAWGLSVNREKFLKQFYDEYSISISEETLASIHSVEFFNSMCFIRKKEPSKNILGRDWVVGSEALVDSRVFPRGYERVGLQVPVQGERYGGKKDREGSVAISTSFDILKDRGFNPIGEVTVVLNNRNLLTWPKAMVNKIQEFRSLAEILIIDNGSTYEPLLDWYVQLPHRVIRIENLGHVAPWVEEINNEIKTDFYVVSDPDLDISSVPNDCLEHLAMCLIRFKEFG